jgi:hypothetical protein
MKALEIAELEEELKTLKSDLEETKSRHIYLKHIEGEAELLHNLLDKAKEDYKSLDLDYRKQVDLAMSLSYEIETLKTTEFNRGVKECFDFITGIAANTDDIIKSTIIQDTAEYMLETLSPTFHIKWKDILELQKQLEVMKTKCEEINKLRQVPKNCESCKYKVIGSEECNNILMQQSWFSETDADVVYETFKIPCSGFYCSQHETKSEGNKND